MDQLNNVNTIWNSLNFSLYFYNVILYAQYMHKVLSIIIIFFITNLISIDERTFRCTSNKIQFHAIQHYDHKVP